MFYCIYTWGDAVLFADESELIYKKQGLAEFANNISANQIVLDMCAGNMAIPLILSKYNPIIFKASSSLNLS